MGAGCLALTLFGQNDAEIDALRKQLGLSDTTPVSVTQDKSLPPGTVKVFLALGSGKSPKDNFLDWIKSWNKKNGKQYGQVEIAPGMENADIVLAWRMLPELAAKKEVTEEHQVSMPHIAGQGGLDPTMQQGKVLETRQVMMAPAFGYVLRPTAGRWEILARWSGDEPAKATDKSGQDLWDSFTALRKPAVAPPR
jgi:hypothetical protein